MCRSLRPLLLSLLLARSVAASAQGTAPKNVKAPVRANEVVTIAAKPRPGCPAGMVFIPGGTFDMGDENNGPIHKVTVRSFCIDRTEHAETNGMPTVNVDWNHAKRTCKSEGKRLPTEAEWEFAARGTQGRKYPWGNSEPTCDKANYMDCGGSARRVGSLPAGATPEGVQDLAGNVWEWVADCYGSYSSSPQSNPGLEPSPCQGARVNRGGGFFSNGAQMRSSVRDREGPKGTHALLGFRCARGAER